MGAYTMIKCKDCKTEYLDLLNLNTELSLCYDCWRKRNEKS